MNKKNKLLVNNKSIHVNIKFFGYNFLLFIIIISNCGSRRTDLLPSGLMLLYELEITFARRADKQI